MTEMFNTMRYMCHFDGKHSWAEVESAYDTFMSPKVQVGGKDKTHDFAGWKQVLEKMYDSGAVFKILKLEAAPPSESEFFIFVAMNLTQKEGESTTLQTKFFFEDGKLVRSQPLDPSLYDKISS